MLESCPVAHKKATMCTKLFGQTGQLAVVLGEFSETTGQNRKIPENFRVFVSSRDWPVHSSRVVIPCVVLTIYGVLYMHREMGYLLQ